MFRFLPFLILVIALAACTEGTYERHESYFYPQRPDGQLLYADQTMDTTLIYSLDSWQATKEGDWFSITPESFEVKPGVSIFNKMTFTTTPNTTGKGRTGLVTIHAYHTISQSLYQTPWLNITYPFAQYTKGEDHTFATRKATFRMALLSSATSSQVRFTTYAENATLTSNAEWVTPEKTIFLAPNSYEVKLTIQPNKSKDARSAQLTLTSAGISTPITVEQAGDPEAR